MASSRDWEMTGSRSVMGSARPLGIGTECFPQSAETAGHLACCQPYAPFQTRFSGVNGHQPYHIVNDSGEAEQQKQLPLLESERLLLSVLLVEMEDCPRPFLTDDELEPLSPSRLSCNSLFPGEPACGSPSGASACSHIRPTTPDTAPRSPRADSSDSSGHSTPTHSSPLVSSDSTMAAGRATCSTSASVPAATNTTRKTRQPQSPSRCPAAARGGETSASSSSVCQIDTCRADISGEQAYHKRRRLCRQCVLATSVFTEGREKRFCQQCSHLHNIEEFDGNKKSCRMKLLRHKLRARRVRKQSSPNSP